MAFDIGSFLGSNIGDAVAKIIGCFKVSPDLALEKQVEVEKIKAELQEKLIDQITAQIDVDKQEAANTNMFVAGWRPFCGWVCGVGLGVQFLVNPIATWVAALYGHPISFPQLDLGTLITLLLGMLGLGGLRSYDKAQGAVGSSNLQ